MFSEGVNHIEGRTLCLWNRIALAMLLLQEKPSINDLTKLLLLTINHVKLSINCKTNQWRNFGGQSDKEFKIHFNIIFESRTFSLLIFVRVLFSLQNKIDWKRFYTMYIHENGNTETLKKRSYKQNLSNIDFKVSWRILTSLCLPKPREIYTKGIPRNTCHFNMKEFFSSEIVMKEQLLRKCNASCHYFSNGQFLRTHDNCILKLVSLSFQHIYIFPFYFKYIFVFYVYIKLFQVCLSQNIIPYHTIQYYAML